MIVNQIGYLKLEDVLKLEHFSIYETKKKTHILVKDISYQTMSFYYPKLDRLPWKDVEGKKICTGYKVFDSKINSIEELKIDKWNGGKQIMAYEEFSLTDYNK